MTARQTHTDQRSDVAEPSPGMGNKSAPGLSIMGPALASVVLSVVLILLVGGRVLIPGPGQGKSLGFGPIKPSAQLPVARTFELSHVDPERLAAALGNDPLRIFQYVRDQVAFEPYLGSLRGPRGTLMAMAGNSVDRAHLLASLLTYAGHRIRYARGVLPEKKAEQLVDSIWTERPQAVRQKREGAPSPELNAAGQALIRAIRIDDSLLRDTLKNAGYPSSTAFAINLASLVKEARDHYWVEWWKDGTWIDLDPSFETATPGTTYTKAEETFDRLPEALFHRVEIHVRLEEYTDGKPSIREVLQHTANAADLSGVDLVLIHTVQQPEKQGTGYLSPFSAGSAETGQAGEVKPLLLLQEQQIVGLPFRLKAPADRSSGGLDELSGEAEATESVPVATAEFIDLEFLAPGGRKETVVRDVFDLVGKRRRLNEETLSADEVRLRSETAHSFDVTNAIYDLFITTGAIHATHLDDLTGPPPPSEGDPVDVVAGLRRLNLAFTAISDALLRRISGGQTTVCRFYVDSPRVQIAEFVAGAGGARLGLDLRRDEARAVVNGFGKEQMFYAQVFRGVVDGSLERIVLDYFTAFDSGKTSPWTPTISTSSLFEQARGAATPVILLSRDSAALADDVPHDSRARIDEALVAGFVVLAPKQPVVVAGARRFAWWQVDTSDGTTTAVTDEGLHQATVEFKALREGDNRAIVYMRYKERGETFIYKTRFSDCRQAVEFINRMKAFVERTTLDELLGGAVPW